MKKIILLCVAVLTAITMSAENKTQTSVGIVGGLGIGAQAKFMFTEHFGLMEELGYFFCPDGGTAEKYGRSSYAGLMDNVVLLYQQPIKETDGLTLSWYAGGQVKLGWMPFNFQRNVHMGIFGVGAAGGIDVKMKKLLLPYRQTSVPDMPLCSQTSREHVCSTTRLTSVFVIAFK